MTYEMSDGSTIVLSTNKNIAEYIYLVMPYKNVKFVGEKPKLVIDKHVTEIIKHSEYVRRVVRKKEMMDDDLDWDKIPF